MINRHQVITSMSLRGVHAKCDGARGTKRPTMVRGEGGDERTTEVSIRRAAPEHAGGAKAAEFIVSFTPKASGTHELRCAPQALLAQSGYLLCN